MKADKVIKRPHTRSSREVIFPFSHILALTVYSPDGSILINQAALSKLPVVTDFFRVDLALSSRGGVCAELLSFDFESFCVRTTSKTSSKVFTVMKVKFFRYSSGTSSRS